MLIIPPLQECAPRCDSSCLNLYLAPAIPTPSTPPRCIQQCMPGTHSSREVLSPLIPPPACEKNEVVTVLNVSLFPIRLADGGKTK